MSRINRRAFASSLLATSAVALGPRLAAAGARRHAVGATVAPGRTGRPSKFVVILLAGGMDELFTVNPRERGEVKAEIGPCFDPREVTTLGSLRLGPGWSALVPHMHRMQVIAGVQVDTVAHRVGYQQIYQMQRNIALVEDAAFTTLMGGVIAPAAPLHSIDLSGELASGGRNLTDAGGTRLSELHAIANDDRAREIALQALRCSIDGRCEEGARESFRIVAHLLERMKGTALPAPPPETTRIDPASVASFIRPYLASSDGLDYSWIRYILEHDLSPTVLASPPMFATWDTHVNNNHVQSGLNRQTAHWLKYLFDELERVPRPHGGTLLDETGFVIVSEMGRFPSPNSYGGKDHFPQVAVTLMGPGLVPGKFGDTGLDMMGVEVSLATGRPGKHGSLMTLDDVGRTLLEWAGHDRPRDLGYSGRLLEFAVT